MNAITPVSTKVQFADKKLEAVIRTILNKPIGDITTADCETITSIEAQGKGISCLCGIENCVNLKYVDLGQLHNPTEEFNYIKDIRPLLKCTKLESITLCSNLIADFTGISSLKNVTALNINYNGYKLGDSVNGLDEIKAMSQITDLRIELNGLTTAQELDLFKDKPNLIALRFNSYGEDTSSIDLSFIKGSEKITTVSKLTKPTVEQIEVLKSLNNLKDLFIIGTDQDVAELQKILPNCNINN